MKSSQLEVNIKPLGDSALIIQLGEGINLTLHQQVKSLSAIISSRPFEGIIEFVPAYNNITVYYNPFLVHNSHPGSNSAYDKVSGHIKKISKQIKLDKKTDARIVTIPVCYGGQFGPDLVNVAALNNLSVEEVITIHTSSECLVYMLGFAPGFPFMGGMDERIATPRRETPRLKIPRGSVGIAGKQTGIYSLETPGGWQIIGGTPLDLFLPKENPPTLLQAGDQIRFVSITPEEYLAYEELKT
ncbi:inhibitor of KinA [Psychrobacillus sp. OK028]|uniref:5-oxoprolinase subunit PxpB n=1 Tax=Psychrobacillus sp. OK028 TaxID=1884359 RepID=UPI00087E295D|nr:5-oxoprolinase subunit PxpB [Psychrobacillus sp. OK028]SDN04523.1 inhibitor of KinA [Psychrobacillus sp. OK028]